MIEWAMLFALGALAASLLWLVALPILARRARRLAEARLARAMPVSMAEVAAERDQMRASHAVALRQLEQARDETGDRAAALMRDNGRHVTRIVELQALNDGLEADKAQLGAELREAIAAMHGAQGEYGAQTQLLHDTLGLAARRGELLTATEARLAAMAALVDERQGVIARLEARATAQDMRLHAEMAQLAKVTEENGKMGAARRKLEGERDAARTEAVMLGTRRDALQASLDALTLDVARLRGERDAAARAARDQADRAPSPDVFKALTGRVVSQDEEIDALRAQVQALREAPPVAAGPARRDSEAGLREAVALLGADLVAFATQAKPPA